MKYLSRILLSFLLFLFSPSSIFAASISLSESSPNTLSDPSIEYKTRVSLSIDSPDGTIYYLRGVFYPESTNNYCGFTWNGQTWFSGPYTSGEGWKNFPSVTVSSSSADIELKAKIDTHDSGCMNSGKYKFKIQRFTQAGSGSFDSQNEQDLDVIVPTVTTTPVPTPNPTASPQPTNTPKPPTSTTVPITSVLLPTSKTVTISQKVVTGITPYMNEVLGAQSPLTTPPPEVLKENSLIKEAPKNDPLLLAKVFIGSGAILIVVSIGWIGWTMKKT